MPRVWDALTLKIFANAMYGFFAEVNPENVKPLQVKVFKGKDSYSLYTPKKKNPRDTVGTIEKQGQWYAPYLASLITAGGRLLLGMIEESVSRAGGTYLYADTARAPA
jgi:DNA polymerase elongation subunit (family B)